LERSIQQQYPVNEYRCRFDPELAKFPQQALRFTIRKRLGQHDGVTAGAGSLKRT